MRGCRDEKADIGLIGLAVMGENLVMNMESKGFTVAVFNRTTEKVDKFVNGQSRQEKISSAATVSKNWLTIWKSRARCL